MKPFPRARAISSKESRPSLENGETSFRVYYGATGAAIPFMWESQPGTPKHPNFDKNDNIVPPLTPPPSFTSTPSRDFSGKARKHNKIFRAFLSSFSRRSRSHVTPTPSLSYSNSYSSPLSWSTSSTSSSSPLSSPRKKCDISHRRNFSFCTSSSAKSSLFAEEEEEHNGEKYQGSTLCFGFKTQQRY